MNTKLKRTLQIAERVLVILVVAIAVFMMVFTIVSVSTFNRKERSLFGLQFYIVKSDSMKATHFEIGDLVVAKRFDYKDEKQVAKLKKGSIITFESVNDDDSYGELITHRIIDTEVYTDPDTGEKLTVYVTQGSSNEKPDEKRVEPGYIYSVYLFDIPNAGHFFNFLRTTRGYVTCILVPFLLLILYQGYICVRLFLRYRSEQLAGIREREAQLDAERRELEALRAQLRSRMPEPSEPEAPAPAEEDRAEASSAPTEE